MRKAIKFILIFAVLLPVVLLGTGVAVVYGLFYDSTSSPILKDENFNEESMVKNIVYQSFENVKETQAITVGLNEDDINQLLLRAVDSMNETAKKFVGAPYVDISEKDKTFDVYLNVGVPIFKTRVKLSTTIDFTRQGEENHREGVMFKINDIKIGRTSVDDFVLGIAKKFVNNETIENAFKSAGFNIKCDLENKTLFYSVHDLLNDVMKDSGIDPFYMSMIDMAVERDLLGISYAKDSFGLDLKLNKLLSHPLADDTRNLGYGDKINTYLGYAETLLTQNLISEDNVPLVLDYFCDGYENTSADNKAFIDSIEFPSSIPVNKKTHLGLNNINEESIDHVFKKQLPLTETDLKNTLINQSYTVTFKESDLNKTLVSSSIIGQNVPFVFKGATSWYVNAIYIDDFYVNILDNQLNFILSVNINGLPTKLVVPCKIVGQEGMSLKLEIGEIYYGQVKANEKMTNQCIDYITDALKNLNLWFKKGEGNSIIFDLSSCIEQISSEEGSISKIFKEKLQSATISSELVGIKSEQDGELKLAFKYAYSM